jgi:hypothetical protein
VVRLVDHGWDPDHSWYTSLSEVETHQSRVI